ncbi:MAG TPA: 2,3-bisphosphoglycerate-independent phosphoglycerate mutase [Candidatus Bathyarchaeia archaeon]|nr:2,3-bisphosphoglycerate-independent phosphoglycerate mutase [Candidatus Bathyarchaeia archaeon]
MSDKKAVLIIVDGMADRPLIEHDYKTPLEYANTPNIDRLAKGGLVGMLDPISPGVRAGTDVAALALLGYDPEKYYTGRGALEAIGAGIELRPGDVAFRCNFATVDDDFRVIDRRAGRIRKGVSKLGKATAEIKVDSVPGVKTIFRPTVEHRAVLVLRGDKLSRMVSDTDPKEEGYKVGISRAKDGTEEAKRTAGAVNEFVKRSHEALRELPLNKERESNGEKTANIVITRGAGTIPELPGFKSRYDLRGACISGTPVINGIATAAGMEIIDVKGATGTLNTDYESKAKAAISGSRDSNFVVVHVKAPDIAGHDADFKGKVRALEDVDRMVGNIIDEVDIGTNYVCLTSDHATPVGYGSHTGDPVPIVVGGPDVPASRILKLSEASASRGNLGRIRGIDLMPVLTDLMGRSRLYGS